MIMNEEFLFRQPQGTIYETQTNLNAFVLKIFPKYFMVLIFFFLFAFKQIPRLSQSKENIIIRYFMPKKNY